MALIGIAYQTTLSARGGTPPYTWGIFAGRLPTGLSLSPAGVISGTPSAAGSFEFTLQATDRGQAIGRLACSMRVAGDLLVGPSSLAFRAISNGATPPSQIVQAAAEGTGFGVSVTASEPWIRITQLAGGTPFVVEIAADPTGLAPGEYSGIVEFRLGGASQLTQRVNLSFRVDPTQPPVLSPDPAAVTVSVPFSNQEWSRTVNLINRGSTAASFTGSVEYDSGDGWLDASGLSGTVNRGASVALQLSSSGPPLRAGVYRARIRIRNTTANQDITISVTLAISGRAAIQLTQTGLSFRAVSGAPAPRAQSFQVLAAGEGNFNWTASAIVDPGLPSWLAISRSSGVSGDRVDVSVNLAGLAPGDYLGEIRVEAAGIDNSPRIVFCRSARFARGNGGGPRCFACRSGVRRRGGTKLDAFADGLGVQRKHRRRADRGAIAGAVARVHGDAAGESQPSLGRERQHPRGRQPRRPRTGRLPDNADGSRRRGR